MGVWDGCKDEITKESQEVVGSDGYVHYFDCGDDFTSINTWQNIQLNSSNMYNLLNVNYILVKLFFKIKE
jgi:hypothetical protein